jgi:hypothetical protein
MALGKRTVENAEGWAEGAIQAACLVISPDLGYRWSDGHWLVLVLTTDELCVLSMRFDTELMRVPLGEVDRFDRRFSFNPLVKGFSLAFTDGQRMTLWVARGPWNQYGDVSRAFRAVGASR